MRFFAQIVFICNLCFLFAVVVQLGGFSQGDAAAVDIQPTGPVLGVILILYYLSFILNALHGLLMLFVLLRRKSHAVPAWLLYSNILILFFQFYYFFIV